MHFVGTYSLKNTASNNEFNVTKESKTVKKEIIQHLT